MTSLQHDLKYVVMSKPSKLISCRISKSVTYALKLMQIPNKEAKPSKALVLILHEHIFFNPDFKKNNPKT